MNMPWKWPLSSNLASSTQCLTLLKSHDLSRGCRHKPGDWWPLQDSTKALMMSFFLAAAGAAAPSAPDDAMIARVLGEIERLITLNLVES